MQPASLSVNAPSVSERPSMPLAGLLSYLVPGLGQIYQGRIAKGLLFFVSVYTLFFYGMYLGSARVTIHGVEYVVSSNVYLPDTAEKNNPFSLPRPIANLYNRPQFAGQFWVGIAAWPAVWQYWAHGDAQDKPDPWLGNFQRTPSEAALNAVHTSGDKLMELGWVYTVIAGVLNIMVIYDALAGPAFLLPSKQVRLEEAA
jgi:TM2 domain-containing membrane protein YozV